MDNEALSRLQASMLGGELRECFNAIEKIAGYKLSGKDKQPFLFFNNFISKPEPKFIASWRTEKAQEFRYHKFVGGFSTHVQNGFACVLYHHQRLIEIENEIIEAIERYDYRNLLGEGLVAGGNILKWDFEYQAFILAYRRCLDYLARAISGYFKNECNSFKRLASFLSKQHPRAIAEAIIPTHEKYYPQFRFVISEGEKKSVRDKIAHYEHVSAGVINLSRRGFIFVNIEEGIRPEQGRGNVLLSELLNTRVSTLRSCIRDMMYAYVETLRKIDKQGR